MMDDQSAPPIQQMPPQQPAPMPGGPPGAQPTPWDALQRDPAVMQALARLLMGGVLQSPNAQIPMGAPSAPMQR